MKHLASLVLIWFLCLCFACEKCDEQSQIVLAQQELLLQDVKQQCSIGGAFFITSAIPGTKKTFVINSNKEYYEHFNCGLISPQIDFSKYSLLAGSLITKSCGKVTSQQVNKECNHYSYSVIIEQTPCDVVSRVEFAILVNKIDKNAKVDFNIKSF